MTPTKEQFIADLNKALEWEYAAAVQYVQHASMITGPEYDAIRMYKDLIEAAEQMQEEEHRRDIMSSLGR